MPADPALSIEAYLPNGDIGFVRTGQAVSVKLEAFPFTRYGTVPGVITHIAKNAIPEPDAQLIEADPRTHHRRRSFARLERRSAL
ncbi:HlyD family secretion protein [Rhizobium laguerreae]|uniref:HlyD family efflux transporter periplasmic adaptor subunit n=1 Tax=Rhizobium laguerreae TaxID=1076926 RepID=UPI0028AC9327|nr:HlyD family secretion protein [Rhizobium laguerreae]